jgi:hypothetical protein
MEHNRFFSAILVAIAASAGSAAHAQTQIQCEPNPMTGKLQATLAWRNTLGAERADAACRAQVVSTPNAASAAQQQQQASTAPQQAQASFGAPVRPPVAAQAVATANAPATQATTRFQPGAPSMQGVESSASAAQRMNLVPAYPGQVFADPPKALPPVAQLQPQAPTVHQSGSVEYSISQSDKNFRLALVKWATASGWSFEPEHWGSDRDIPVVGSATFAGDFKSAVRALLKSTALGDRELQPCFYSNNVLRVIPAAELCARSTS